METENLTKIVCPVCKGEGRVVAPTVSWYIKCNLCKGDKYISTTIFKEIDMQTEHLTEELGGWQEGFPS